MHRIPFLFIDTCLAYFIVTANFFEERIEAVELLNGGQALFDAPRRVVQSATDLPNDFDVNTISATNSQLSVSV